MSQPSLSLAHATSVVAQFGLLHEVITADTWTSRTDSLPQITFNHLTYDTRTIADCGADTSSLLFIKGNFDPKYLQDLDRQGLAGYVAEQDYSAFTSVPGIIVSDVYAAMARLAAEFYGHPEQQLTIIGLTGTKGKTTTAFLTFALLQQVTHQHTALISSQSVCIDGTTLLPSHLTTPESLDSYHMMAEALQHGITHVVMEISSQAYKIGRVIGIHFATAAFLNISPDHISPIEHPTFENYLYCKRQIIQHTDQLIVNADCDYLALLLDDAATRSIPVTLCTMSTQKHTDVKQTHAKHSDSVAIHDNQYQHKGVTSTVHTEISQDHRHFVTSIDQEWRSPELSLLLPGSFNIANAQVAMALVHSVGLDLSNQALEAMMHTRVPGRMERIEAGDGTTCIIDYAHNYLSVHSLIAEAEQEFEKPYIIVLSGSTGGKALDRREGIIQACQEGARAVVLTTDDANFEDPADIAHEMQSYITDPALFSTIIVDREQAVYAALHEAHRLRQEARNTEREYANDYTHVNGPEGSEGSVGSQQQYESLGFPALDRPDQPIVLLCAGKGAETHQILRGKSTDYIGDREAISRALNALQLQ